MTQIAPRSAFKFIPEPIQQQLAMYQTGEPLDFYQWGWVRKSQGDKKAGSPKLWGFLMTLAGLATTIGAAWAISDSVNTIYIPPLAAGLILGVPILLLLIGPVFFFQSPPFCVIVFRDCFVFVKKERVIALYWHEIASFERKKIVRSWMPEIGNTTYRYTIRTHDGRKLRWKVVGYGMEELGNKISERIG